MQRPALYFPYIHIRDDDWLKVAALYWPSVRRLVPPGYEKRDSRTAQAFADAEILQDENPGHLLDSMAWDLLEALRCNADRLRRRYSVDNAITAWDGGPWADGRKAPVGGRPELGWIHLSKFPRDVVDYLVSVRLAERGRPTAGPRSHHGRLDAWIGLHPALAGAYMTALARQISARAHFQPLTDQQDLKVATSSKDVRGAINLLLGPEHVPTAADLAAEGIETYVMLALSHARPRDLASISAESIIRCREKLAEELATFRSYVASQQAELAELAAIPLTNRKLEAFAEHVAETIELPLQNLEKGLRLLRLEPTRSLLLAGSLTTPVAISPLVSATPAAAAVAGVTAAVGGAWWNIGAIRSAARTQSPVGYLLDARDQLTPKTLSARVRRVLRGTYAAAEP